MLSEQKSLKALVIDDDPVITKVVARVLAKRMQMEVREANSAREALTLLEQEVPDIMIVDYMMPIMTGKDLITLLKADDKFKNIPIIVLSALNDPELIKEIFTLKVDDYILKPVSPQVIHERVVKVLKNAREKKESSVSSQTISNSILFIGSNKFLADSLNETLKNKIDFMDFSNLPNKAFNLFLQKLHKVVILESIFTDVVNNLIIEKVKEASPNTALIYLVKEDSSLLFLSQDRKNLPKNIDEILSLKISCQKLAEIVEKII
jgi:DNA-binding response OmpR family regulator